MITISPSPEQVVKLKIYIPDEEIIINQEKTVKYLKVLLSRRTDMLLQPYYIRVNF